MTTYEVIEDIYAPLDTVWTVLTDLERWPEWTASVQSIQRADTAPLAVGSKATIRQPDLGESVWTITAFDAPRSFTWETSRSGVTLSASHVLTEKPGGTNVKLAVELKGPFAAMAAAVVRPTIERYIAAEAAGLKNRCEEPR